MVHTYMLHDIMHTELLTYTEKVYSLDMLVALSDLDVASLEMYTLHPWHGCTEWEHLQAD